MTAVGFVDLVAPTGAEEFFARHWDREPLLASSVAGAEDLVTVVDVERLVSSLPTPGPDWVQVVRDGRPLSQAALSARDTSPSLPAVTAAVRAGHTVQLAKLHRRHPPAAALCRDTERAFLRAGVALARHAGSHLYLTPPGSVGLRPHYDDHSVFAVQVAGAKVWRLHRPVRPFPTSRQLGPIDPDELGPADLEVELAAGQALYVPRGWVHETRARDATSIHVTVDLYPLTWADLAGRVLADDEAAREALPPGAWLPAGQEDLAAALRDRAGRAVSERAVAAAVSSSVEDFLLAAAPLAGDGLLAGALSPPVTRSTVLRCRRSAMATFVAAPGRALLGFAGSGLHGGPEAEKLLRFLAETDRFTLDDLPGGLGDDERRALVEDLLGEGLLEVVPAEGGAGADPA